MLNLPRPALMSAAAVGGLIVLGQYLHGLAELHEAILPLSSGLADAMVVLTVTATAGLGVTGARWIQQLWRSWASEAQPVQSRRPARPPRPKQTTQAHVQDQITSTDDLIAQLQDEIMRRSLQERSQRIIEDLSRQQFHLAVFGTASAGKTSLINALLGRWVGETAPTLGTTEEGSVHTIEIEGVSGPLLITDTPGLQTISGQGEAEARSLAQTADLLVFVVSGDLRADEYEELMGVAQLGKRTILALNKTDQLIPEDVETIREHLQQCTAAVIPADSVVAIAADPQPLKVKRWFADGSVLVEYEDQPPEVQPLMAQVASILKREGAHLRLANALLQSQTLAETAHQILEEQRFNQAQQVIERMQWATAGAVAVTPLPALDLVAAVAINARLIGELHTIYDRKISLRQAKEVAQSLGHLLLKLGGVELATQTIGAVLKTSPLAMVGIPIQAASAAYLSRIAGLSYIDWLRSETPWEEAEMAACLERHLQDQAQSAFLSQLVTHLAQVWRSNATPLSNQPSS